MSHHYLDHRCTCHLIPTHHQITPYHAYQHGHCHQILNLPPHYLLPHFLPINCPHNGYLHQLDQTQFHLHFSPPHLLPHVPQLQFHHLHLLHQLQFRYLHLLHQFQLHHLLHELQFPYLHLLHQLQLHHIELLHQLQFPYVHLLHQLQFHHLQLLHQL